MIMIIDYDILRMANKKKDDLQDKICFVFIPPPKKTKKTIEFELKVS